MTTYGRVKDSKTQADEHVVVGGVSAKRVLLSGYDSTNINDAYIDSNGNLHVSVTASAISNGSKDISNAGTAETLVGSATPAKKVWIWCNDDNTGAKVYVGGSTVSSSSGKPLYKGETIQIEIDDLEKIYIDVDTNGDGVKFTYTS